MEAPVEFEKICLIFQQIAGSVKPPARRVT